MQNIEILIIGKHPDIMKTILRLLNNKTGWNGTAAFAADEAIEKGVNVTFDLFQRSPIDNLFEYGKFLAKNGGMKEKMGF